MNNMSQKFNNCYWNNQGTDSTQNCVQLVSFFLCKRGVEDMSKATKKERHMKARKGKSERLTESEIKDLMGVNMPVYRRGKGGALRQR
jgi:hypothetical protein